MVIARVGASPSPMDNYDVRVRENDPLGFRELRRAPTLVVDRATGRITAEQTPAALRFKDGNRVRPIAPFLELWCDTGDGVLRPLTTAILTAEGLTPASVRWQARAANLKAFRRTTITADRIEASTGPFTDHQPHALIGNCTNFIAGKTIPFGDVQYIQPTAEFPQVRLRFTPGRGFVYGSSKRQPDPDTQDIVYRGDRPWSTFAQGGGTVPGGIFAGAREGVSRGYLDDTCDGIVDVQITVGGTTLATFARFSSGPPDYAPDSFPVRTIVDELEQALLGPTIDVADASPQVVEEIIRRAFETIRLQHTAGLNGNPGLGIGSIAGHDARREIDGGPGRAMEPIMARALVDNLALRTLHQSIYGALKGDTAAWFGQVLRDWDQVADLTNAGRRKMPAMMRGSDGYHLALTRRQVDTVRKSSMQAPTHLTQPQPQGGNPPAPLNQTARASAMLLSVKAMEGVEPRPQMMAANALVEQITYRAQGNPPGTLLTTAISNCFPGLEFDFRNVWKRFFVEIEMHEADNRVTAALDPAFANLVGRNLMRIEHGGQTVNVTTTVIGPRTEGGATVTLAQGRRELLEWSNSLATILATAAGQQVNCTFTNAQGGQAITRPLTVRGIFAPGTAAIPDAVAKPGELSQSLCSPWQNDYLECGCYYWAASRPDYVNVEPGPEGASIGHNWTQVRTSTTRKTYLPDPPAKTPQSIWYDDLFQRWQEVLRFQIEGKDAE
jgi:hypothetical protein